MAGIYSVAQVNSYIKNMFSQDFALNHIFNKGEISNCKYHPSGHLYFTLKDDTGLLSAVMFARQRNGLKFRLAEGQQVIVEGSINVYERDGKYQVYVKDITLDGAGDLYRQFEELRNKLEEMGMFSSEYKRPIPSFGRHIGIVTASSGAAIRDIINIAHRRNPYVQLYLYPALVQGEGAGNSIIQGINVLDAMNLDCIIIGRGGGSIEDLWAFNEERVARAIFNCKTPIISAVGHETDVTIADYVADMRAPTPSAAAELAVFDYRRLEETLNGYKERLTGIIRQNQENKRNQLERRQLLLKLYHPNHQLAVKRQDLMELEDKLSQHMKKRLMINRHRLELIAGRLQGVSPLQKLGNGYAYVTDDREKKIESVTQLETGRKLKIRWKDGNALAKVIKIQEEFR